VNDSGMGVRMKRIDRAISFKYHAELVCAGLNGGNELILALLLSQCTELGSTWRIQAE